MEEVKKTPAKRKPKIIKVKTLTPFLVVRTGPGKDHEKTGKHTGIGEFEITKIQKGEGSEAGWGKLKSGDGWISMDYVERI